MRFVPAKHAFEYALLRLVADVEREKFINVGVILHSRGLRYLGRWVCLDEALLAAPDDLFQRLAALPASSAAPW